MPSRTSFFNAAVFKKTLQRWWPLGLGYAAALTFTLLSKVGSAYGSFNPYAYYDAGSRTAAILQEGISSWVPALFAVVMVMAVVSWLFRTRGCAFVAALPVRRETVFVSNLLGALTLLAVVPVITAGALFLFTSTAEGFGLGILRWLVITELLTLAYFGLAALCAALTGHLLAVPALYFLLLFAAAALESTFRRILQFLIFGLGNQTWRLTFLSPIYYLRNAAWRMVEVDSYWADGVQHLRGVYFHGWGAVVLYAAAGIVCALLSVALIRRRRLECAGDLAAEKWLAPVFRMGAAVAAGLTLGFATLQGVFGYNGFATAGASFSRSMVLLVVMLIGAAAGWFGSEMLLRKTVRVFDRHWAGLGVLSALICALVLGCELDVFGVERSVPNIDRVAYAELDCYSLNIYVTPFTEKEDIAALEDLHRLVAVNKKVFERENRTSATGGTLEIRYYDGNGNILMSRCWAAPGGVLAWASRGNGMEATGGNAWGSGNPALRALEELMNRPNMRAYRNSTPDWLEITPLTALHGGIILREGQLDGYSNYSYIRELNADEICDLMINAILPDMEDTSMGYMKLMPEGQITYPTGNLSFSFNFVKYDGGENDLWWYFDPTLTPDAARTIAWLEEHGIHVDENAMVTGVDEDRES